MSGKNQKAARKTARKNAERENLAIITLYIDALCRESLWYRIKFCCLLVRRKNPFRRFQLRTVGKVDKAVKAKERNNGS